jgi:hypothetical protein
MTLISNIRTLMAAVQPATGDRATGAVQLFAATGTIAVPRGTYALPVVGYTGLTGVTGFVGALDPTRAVKVAGGASSTYDVGTTGAYVPFLSNVGGAQHNFPAGTRFLLDPPLSGITGVGLCPTGFAGGANAEGFGAIRDFVLAENLSATDWTVDLARVRPRSFPCVLLTWRELVPSDGSTTPHTLSASRMGEGTKLVRASYTLSVICSRNDNQPWRSMEGYTIVQELMSLLSDRKAVDHEPLSHPSGLQWLRTARASMNKTDYQRFVIYTIDVNTTFSVTRTEMRTFAEWLRSHLMIDKAVGPDAPEGDIRLVDMLVDMRPLSLDVGGEQVQAGDEDVTV